ncbi:ribonuclease E [Algimonas ampicilliniresistens]|uniref:Ribonuclease E n=1 Tax=Algimonas ampicilliniresistens TaxID=1298735 RepID=A0ABQ5V8V3_9PROT|nr:Rne/Rng family ribonuclease [Algimonas ampicilliniresistens]GLQ23174.1 ribonuclease E [Algimonas ampicilliniresistens]
MTKRMLIDAAHPEETRVVIVDGSRVDELDFESRHKRQIRGNVYLAKVTRVEPSLQAAFIDYGGNKHGFLAFSEIHPDYYQIPYEDKLALQQQDEEALSKDSDDDDEVEEDENLDPDEDDASDENDAEVADEQVKVASQRRKQMRRRRYKIQEVIKRGQVLLVQAVKEERGNKGAAMTTYLSLAGRYCVLMPNTPRGGGISRKIPNGADRKRLKSVMDELSVPQGMGVIVRTAGAKRTKAEITRDYSYLSRLWDEIRDTTLKSVAPNLIHEEGNLVKRSIRDLYNKDIEEVLVQGEDAYKNAKSFIKMLMPSHAKFVKRYDDVIPLFLRFNVERQIENSLDATVQLKSGGYLVIHPTEALVSVDVNSGRSTKERNVERTALKTNLEAAEELARQMRLRDLAGLIVVDFIDMDESKNNRSVENKMKSMLSRDRARIQTSRISQFGLMEISRQRRRRSLLEGSTATCSHCDGVGRKRTVESAALAAIRAVEEFAIRGKAKKIRLKCPPDVALYLLNEKRDLLTKVDENADVFTIVEHDDSLIRPAFTIEVAEKRNDSRKDPLTQIEKDLQEETKRSENDRAKAKATKRDDEDESENDDTDAETTEARDEDGDSKPRRRRGRRGGRNRKKRPQDTESSDEKSDDEDIAANENASETKSDDSSQPRRRRRRRAPSKSGDAETATESSDAVEQSSDKVEDGAAPSKRRSSSRRKAPTKAGSASTAETKDDAVKVQSEDKPEAEAPKPGRRRRAPSRNKASEDADTKSEDSKPARRRAPAKAKTDSVETDTPVKEAAPKRRRAAPKRTDASATEDKPKPRRRAPAKTAKADDTAAAKPATRRKAPAKAKTATDAVEEAPKPARRRKAPAKAAAAAKAPAKSDDTDGDAKPKPARKRAAPKSASKAAPKKAAPKKPVPKKAAAKADTPKAESDAPKAKPRARKAPAKPKPVDAPAPQAAPAKPTESGEDAGARRRKAPPRRKRGLIDRLMGKE